MSNPQSYPQMHETDEMWRLRQEAERLEQEHGDRRSHERRNIQWPARLVVPEGALNCIVYDLSFGGARVRMVAQLYKHQRVRLDLDKIAPLNADVVWLGIGMLGIRFTDDPAYVARTLGPMLGGN